MIMRIILAIAAALAGSTPAPAQSGAGPAVGSPLGPVDPATQVNPMSDVAVGSRKEDVLLNLPPNIEVISPFGERAIFSPDDRKVLFVGESYGDVFELDMKTREVRNLTDHVPNRGFLRAQYLSDGNYILLGPRSRVVDQNYARRNQIELWFLSKDGKTGLVPLGHQIFEGIATSRLSNRIAWTQYGPNFTPFKSANPGYVSLGGEPGPNEYASLWIGDVVIKGNVASIENAKEVLRKPRTDCMPEPQDFHDQDRELTFSCYRLSGPISAPGGARVTTGIWGLRLDTGKVIRYRGDNWAHYSEPEGIFPDGKSTLFECADLKGGMDLCQLELEPDSRKVTRVTHFAEFEGARASNPTLSSDGKQIVFQYARSGDPSGVGHGLLLMHLP